MDESLRRILDEIIKPRQKTGTPSSKRNASSAINIDPNIRCERIYPTKETRKSVGELKTIGIKLNREQAIHLGRVLLAVSQDWDEIDVTV